jgi:hypothetical protein
VSASLREAAALSKDPYTPQASVVFPEAAEKQTHRIE